MNNAANVWLQNQLDWFFSVIDISDNIERALNTAETRANDFWTSFLHAIVFIALGLGFASAAWYFDFQSTYIGMNTLATLIIPSLPSSIMHVGQYLSVVFTLMPT